MRDPLLPWPPDVLESRLGLDMRVHSGLQLDSVGGAIARRNLQGLRPSRRPREETRRLCNGIIRMPFWIGAPARSSKVEQKVKQYGKDLQPEPDGSPKISV